MKIQITARHLKLTDPIRSYVEEKIQKAQKYFNHIIWAQAVLSVEKRTHQAEVIIHTPKQTFRAQAQGADLYSAIDLTSDKIDIQLKKHKERLRDHHAGMSAAEAEQTLVGTPVDGSRFSFVKKVPMRPISREAAADEMESVGHSFWMFLDEESKQVQVIFRRQDNSYGILKPVKWSGK